MLKQIVYATLWAWNKRQNWREVSQWFMMFKLVQVCFDCYSFILSLCPSEDHESGWYFCRSINDFIFLFHLFQSTNILFVSSVKRKNDVLTFSSCFCRKNSNSAWRCCNSKLFLFPPFFKDSNLEFGGCWIEP